MKKKQLTYKKVLKIQRKSLWLCRVSKGGDDRSKEF